MEILNKLTHTLKKELILKANGNILYQIPLFSKNFLTKVIEKLTFKLKHVEYSPEVYIFRVIFFTYYETYKLVDLERRH